MNLKKAVAIAGVNLLALVNILAPPKSPVQEAPINKPTNEADNLTVASLNASEGSWLKVPMTCKAKGFNADPGHNVSQAASARALKIYATLGNFKA